MIWRERVGSRIAQYEEAVLREQSRRVSWSTELNWTELARRLAGGSSSLIVPDRIRFKGRKRPEIDKERKKKSNYETE